MQKFITENRKTIWTVGKDKSKSEAITMANEKFKTSTNNLDVFKAWEKGDLLYFYPVKGAREVWAVCKGGKG